MISYAQCVCPRGHRILAVSGEGSPDEVCTQLQRVVSKLLWTDQMTPHCWLCGATTDSWLLEYGETPWASMEEATAAMAALGAHEQHYRAAMQAMGLTYDTPPHHRN